MRIALLISVLTTCVCAAQTPPMTCPWLATGSAAAVLGGPVTLSAHVASNQQGMCRFSRESDGNVNLEITIGKDDMHLCPEGSTKLAALGNEALQCRSSNANGHGLDVVAGRMRNLYFAVSIGNVVDVATVPPATERPSDQYGASILVRIAEQVVGNLY
jgi:hypothetical protein